MKIYKKKENIYMKGFTLIETLVAVTILVTSIVGPLTVAYQGVSIGMDSRDRLIASYLAQDAIEYVRYHMVTKSNGGATDVGLMAGLEACDTNDSGKVCQIDTEGNPGTVTGCGGVCSNLSWNTADHYYGYGSGIDWSPANFNREVRIFWDNTGPGTNEATGLGGGTEYRVEVTVYWGKENNRKSLVVVGNMIDWRIIFN
ncbi:MAG: prepilin-type N-terminal cleavage/methylation domain-containing protein [Candidatus Pacebacteria bacterium]|nr:prepilin-type N-terminal cleavage/methylation domain-containing protein [Candidatus Paceibacterota bacterium]